MEDTWAAAPEGKTHLLFLVSCRTVHRWHPVMHVGILVLSFCSSFKSNTFEGWEDGCVWSIKCLSSKPGDPNLVSSTMQKVRYGDSHNCDPITEDVEAGRSLGSLASQPSLSGEPQIPVGYCISKKKVAISWGPNHLVLYSTHKHMHRQPCAHVLCLACICTCVCTDTHFWLELWWVCIFVSLYLCIFQS